MIFLLQVKACEEAVTMEEALNHQEDIMTHLGYVGQPGSSHISSSQGGSYTWAQYDWLH